MTVNTLTQTYISKDDSKQIKNVINTTFDFTLELEPVVVTPKKNFNHSSKSTQRGLYKYNLEMSRLRNLYSKSYYESKPEVPVNKALILEEVESVLALYPNSFYDYAFLERKLREQFDLVLIEEKIEDYVEIANMVYEQ